MKTAMAVTTKVQAVRVMVRVSLLLSNHLVMR